ncbi:MAG: hypothetical protein JJU29_07760 [Verrucomicrobia bacterium]|nr:hypothetical protein [Verrucomicrobiota bacterium]MCH8513407.1 hypothetical protein [Kiritimatiellia bacterium]
MKPFPPAFQVPFHPRALALTGMALVFSLPYRATLLISPPWLAYLCLTLILFGLVPVFLFCPTYAKRDPVPEQRLSFLWFLLPLIAAGWVRFHWIRLHPVEPELGDMLPLISLAGQNFLAGNFPYTEYQVPWPLPLTFFPLLWMSYLPAILLGIDLRWTGWIATLGVLALLIRHRPRAPLPFLAFALLPVFTFFTVNGHTQPYWLVLCLHLYFLARGKPWLSALFLGLTLSSRQTALIIVPFTGLAWYRTHGLKPAMLSMCIAGGVTAAFCLPFFLLDPDAFLLEPLRHYGELAQSYSQAYSQAHAEGAAASARLLETLGFANLFYVLGAPHLLSPLRILVFLLGLSGCIVFARTPKDHIAWISATGITFTFFTPIPWIYAYFPFWLAGLFAIPGHDDTSPRDDLPAPSLP